MKYVANCKCQRKGIWLLQSIYWKQKHFDYLALVGEIVQEIDLILYILNGLGPRYIYFTTTFNMIQFRPSIGALPSWLENSEW